MIPPLLNDFIGLQKDTALVAFVVAIPEAFKQGQIYQPQTSTSPRSWRSR